MEDLVSECIPTTSRSMLEDKGVLAYRIPPKPQEESAQRCTICNSLFELPRQDGLVETASLLPCSHIFGHICIQRWLETSSNNDCPVCRRSMLYRTCKHTIKACEVGKAPNAVAVNDMPEKCAKCRLEDGGVGMNELRRSREMLAAQERALMGMKQHLPGIFGGLCRGSVESVDGRIEESRKEWGKEADAAFGEVEEKEGRLEW